MPPRTNARSSSRSAFGFRTRSQRHRRWRARQRQRSRRPPRPASRCRPTSSCQTRTRRPSGRTSRPSAQPSPSAFAATSHPHSVQPRWCGGSQVLYLIIFVVFEHDGCSKRHHRNVGARLPFRDGPLRLLDRDAAVADLPRRLEVRLFERHVVVVEPVLVGGPATGAALPQVPLVGARLVPVVVVPTCPPTPEMRVRDTELAADG